MLGKLIVHGASREEAIAKMITALAGTQVLGLPTNRAFLAVCLQHPVFRAGDALIPFLDEHGDAIRQTLGAQQTQLLLPAALAIHFGSGPGAAQVLPCPFGKALRFLQGEQLLDLTVTETGQGQLEIAAGPQQHAASCMRQSGGQMVVMVDGVMSALQVCRVPDGRWHVQAGATDVWLKDASFEPSAGPASASSALELRAPFNGKVIAVNAVAGAEVRRGDTLLVIESMKLEHAVCATRDAVLGAVEVDAGRQVASGQVLLRFAA
jgi:geranyl-CoA carboxylase alpha subunit